MGNCGSTEEGTGAGYASVGSGPNSPQVAEISRSIDRMLKQDEKRLAREHKLLLLGAGESGKTTILKQMKIIHQGGFAPSEVEYYRRQVFDNLCSAIRLVLDAMDEWMLDVSEENRHYLPLFVEVNPMLQEDEPFPEEYREALSALWKDKNVQRALTKANEAPIPENIQYFFPELDRLFQSDYGPTLQDILHARGKTTGISETIFENKNFSYRLFDVGGQRSERKKWIHCFENVTAVIFLAALPGYDQCLLEDSDSNVMQEALMLFDSVCNSKWFTRTSMILFLNKTDLFKEKILVSDISKNFPDYEGAPTDYNAAREFFQHKFEALNRSKEKDIYTHFTCAVDTQAVKVVMTSVADIVLSSNLNQMMF